MSRKRRKHSADFKAKVVLDMLKERETLSELASKYEVHPTQLTKWKRHFVEKAPELFSEKGSKSNCSRDAIETELYKKIGQLQVELDFLKKKSGIYL